MFAVHLVFWQSIVASVVISGLSYFSILGSLWLSEKVTRLEDSPREGWVPIFVLPPLCGIVSFFVIARSPTFFPIMMAVILLLVLSAAWTSDAKRGLVFDWFTLPPLALIFFFSLLYHDIFPVVSALVVSAPFAFAALVSHGKGMGWGDVKLIALGSSIVGLQAAIFVLTAACLFSAFLAAIRGRRHEPIAFAPYISAFFGLALVFPQSGVL